MPLTFPNNPVEGQQHEAGGTVFVFTGGVWAVLSQSAADFTQAAALYGRQRNRIINGDFRVAQRGSSSPAPSGGAYAADRWIGLVAPTAGTVSTIATPPGFLPDEAPEQFLRLAVPTAPTGGGGAAFVQQRIEDVRGFAGKTVTISGYVRLAAAGQFVAISLLQAFGAGGSASVNVAAQVVVSEVGWWQRFELTFEVPSVAGKTIGAGNYTALEFWYGGGVNYLSRHRQAGGFSQAGHIDLADVQAEVGAVATPFERRPYGEELALCQRYFWGPLNEIYSTGYGDIAQRPLSEYLSFPVQMRTIPSISHSTASNTNVYTATPSANQNFLRVLTYNAVPGWYAIGYRDIKLDAEL